MILSIINDVNVEIQIKNCVLKNNSAALSLFSLQNTKVTIKDLTLRGNTGRIINAVDFILGIENANLQNHLCLTKGLEACFIFMENGNLSIFNLAFDNVTSFFSKDLIFSKNSFVFLRKVFILKVETAGMTLLFTGKTSSVSLENCSFEKLNKSLLILESNSTLSISFCFFSEFNVIEAETHMIRCDECFKIHLKSNVFQKNLVQLGSSLHFTSG